MKSITSPVSMSSSSLDVAQRLEDDDTLELVLLDLGPLLAVHGVLDREGVEVELLVDSSNSSSVGSLSPIQRKPPGEPSARSTSSSSLRSPQASR